MIRIAVSTRDKIGKNLRDDNVRGESRWERQCMEALLQCDWVDVVSTITPYTDSNSDVFKQYPKFQDGIRPGDHSKTIMISMDYFSNLLKDGNKYQGLLFNVYNGLWEEALPEVLRLQQEYGQRIVFTHGFPGSTIGPYLGRMIGPDNIKDLPVPGIPNVIECNNFDKDILFWNQRFIYQFMPDKPIELLFTWVAEKLAQDSNKKFVIATGFRDVDVAWHSYSGIESQFWSYESAKILLPFKNRVIVHGSLGWQQMLDIHAQTKAIVAFPASFGGPPLEASMYGIPFVGKANIGPLVECPEYLGLPNSTEEYVALLDKLYTDKEYYTKVGSAYREFVRTRYTYKAFTDNLKKILIDRGMI